MKRHDQVVFVMASRRDPKDWATALPVQHDSARVHCAPAGRDAVISIVERQAGGRTLRFVLWCSLRGCGTCSEQCLGGACTAVAGGSRDQRGGGALAL